ncbi:MAG: flagellar basal-body rod protein FlgG [Holosporales bacterium]|jgi:flagellar basal-body rod protein FlgG|nr:flagellar basal-body rod protein FlgG [Holosporales bacterium]
MSSNSLNIAATGMAAQQQRVDTIANNIANVNTPGYRKAMALFQDLVYQVQRSVGAPTSENNTIDLAGRIQGLGVKLASIIRSHEPGMVTKTDRPLDLVIEGRGFLQIEQPNEEIAYTRAGTLEVNPDGELTTPDGYRLSPHITIPEGAMEITVNGDGQVFAKFPGQVAMQNLGQIELATFPNAGGLKPIGHNLYIETNASGNPITARPGMNGLGTLLQGYLESSNVNIVQELTDLITAQRSYEFNSKVIETSDQMMETIHRM